MKVSVVITVLNEEKSIKKLLRALVNQNKKASEIIIIDAGSTDNTVLIITNAKLRTPNLRLVIKKNMSRSRARNLGVELSKNEIIAMTDAGCVPHKDWLEKITRSFKGTDVVAGFYKMTGKNNLQKAMIPFMGVTPDKFSEDFLPSTRSIAFKKSAWKKIRGFDTKLDGAAEDTMFAYKLVKNEMKITTAKKAIVEWGMPETIFQFYGKIFGYSKGDAKTKTYLHPAKGIWSHNIHTVTIFFRYLVGSVVLFLVLRFNFPLIYFVFGLLVYFIWSIYKTRKTVADWRGKLFIPILQITSDIAVMLGFIWGILGR